MHPYVKLVQACGYEVVATQILRSFKQHVCQTAYSKLSTFGGTIWILQIIKILFINKCLSDCHVKLSLMLLVCLRARATVFILNLKKTAVT